MRTTKTDPIKTMLIASGRLKAMKLYVDMYPHKRLCDAKKEIDRLARSIEPGQATK